MDTKRFFLYFIVITALALAGCGGGGGGMAVTPTEPTEPTEPAPPPGPTPEEMALKDAQDAAMAAYMMAMGYVNSAKDYLAMQNAQKYADMAHDANDAAQAATTSAMAEEYQMKAEMYRDQAMEAAGDWGLGITKLANMMTNRSDRENADLEGRPVPDPVYNAERVGAELQATATQAPAVAETPVVAAVTGPPAVAEIPAVAMGSIAQGGAASVRATRGSTGAPTLTVTLPTEADAVTRGETPTELMMRGDWPGVQLVGEGDGTSKTYANAYTDIQMTRMDPEYVDATGTATVLPTGGVTAAVTGDVPGDGTSFAGTYNSNIEDNQPPVSGLFFCPATTACAISVNDDGELVEIEGYEFRRATGRMMTVRDADYLAWGVWLSVPNAEPADANNDGVEDNPALAGAFASGNNPFEVRAELKGKATYNGVASGLYSAAGMVENFDADVMLEANFGGTEGGDSSGDTDTATNNMFRLGVVTGTVSNINAGGISVAGSLMLGRAYIDTDTANGDSTGGFTSDKVSGTLAGRAMVGNWGGQFYGPNAATADSMAAQTEYPTTAAGTFAASAPGNVNDPVRILGAFGSWKAE